MEEDEFKKNELRDLIRQKKIVIIVGSGVSIATNQKAPTWKGLIKSGAERCKALQKSVPWYRRVKLLLEPDVDEAMEPQEAAEMLLVAAEMVDRKLRDIGEGDFAA